VIQNTLKSQCREYQSYNLVIKSHKYDLLTLIYIVSKHNLRIRNIEEDSMKLSILNNRGCIVNKFVFDDSDVCIINCQLENGQKDMHNRVSHL